MEFKQIDVKPLSINEAYKGRKFKTAALKNYVLEVSCILPKIVLSEPPYTAYFEFGVSSRGFDIDNGIKPLLDILQKKYNFNDNQIYDMHVKKVVVDKGKEYIKFKIEQLGIYT